ncbi:MAG: sigma-70 family RNA polymerase sigma factor [Chthoniobacter sp.]|nr:sigma-70 family RNA polymerase sigma factor [Chthoniobacter sp.]
MNETMTEPSKPLPMQAETAAADPDDLQLVVRAQAGETSAFNELVTRYRSRAFSMIYQMTRNEQDAWDLAQDGFVKAWKNIGRFRGQSSFYTWLYRILMNVTIDSMRRKHIQSGTEFDDQIGLRQIEPGAATAPRVEMQPVENISDREIRTRIDEAIAKLSPEHRAAIVMREIDGLEYTEIAAQMECSLGTVMSRLFYARKKLQALLKDVYENI